MEATTARDKVTKARAGLILQSPFYASIALRLVVKEDNTCDTAWTDGVSFGYNPAFIDRLTIDQCKGLWVHEVLHIAMMHHIRRGARDSQIWNVSADYAIDPIAINAGFTLPDGGHINASFQERSAEQIYTILSNQPKPDKDGDPENQGQGQGQDGQSNQDGQSPQDNQDNQDGQDGQGQSNQGPSSCGEIRDYPGQSPQQGEQEAKIMLQQAIQAAKRTGSMPGDLARMVQDVIEPVLPWREVLQRFVAENARNDYSWALPNRRYLPMGLYMPQLHNPSLKDLVLLVDTSPSISEQDLKNMLSEFQGILAAYDTTLHVVYVSTEVCGSQVLTGYDMPELEPHGDYGTDFRPGFKWIEENQIEPAAIIYFTDGECNQFPEHVEYPLLWVLTERNDYFNPPCGGEVIYMGPAN